MLEVLFIFLSAPAKGSEAQPRPGAGSKRNKCRSDTAQDDAAHGSDAAECLELSLVST